MPPSRVCQECRSAKAKCDLAAPACGRCAARDLTCSGAASNTLVFMDENVVAQRNSWLARRPRLKNRIFSQGVRQTSPVQCDVTDKDLQRQYYWLNSTSLSELPTPPPRDIETKAVKRLFLDWTLNPSNDGRSPGYMCDLPALFSTAQPGTVLWHAVRAVAFAGLKDCDGGSFSLKARQSYGSALRRMRVIINDPQKLTEDRVLAALLLIDVFEKMFLCRRQPLGPHRDALQHILTLRGERQFEGRTQFELWRTAQQRLQAHRISRRDGPDNGQLEWIAKLNASLPDLHVCADVERMVVLCSAARQMVWDQPKADERSAERVGKLEELLQSMRGTVRSMEEWSCQVDAGWRPRRIESDPTGEVSVAKTTDRPFSNSDILEYSDPWLAYKWNFHKAGQIALRQSMIELMNSLQSLQSPEARCFYDEEMAASMKATEELAAAIIASCIPLLGSSTDRQASVRGKMVSRFFAICAMTVVEQAHVASPEQRSKAKVVLGWIGRTHQLR